MIYYAYSVITFIFYIMYRTIISLDEDNRDWLKYKSEREQVSAAEIIRRALNFYRIEESQNKLKKLNQKLDKVTTVWSGEDGLVYQERLRGEWGK